MAGFITYWPKDQISKIKKDIDQEPIKVIFGSAHSKMPSIKSAKVGDILYPVTLMDNVFYVVARLPIETIEIAYDYLVRELGNQCGSLVPEGIDRNDFYTTPFKPHACHQRPFNCCSETAAQSEHGSTIELRPVPKDMIPELRFGPTKSKQIPLRLDKSGNLSVVSLSGNVRKMSEETQVIFESLFE